MLNRGLIVQADSRAAGLRLQLVEPMTYDDTLTEAVKTGVIWSFSSDWTQFGITVSHAKTQIHLALHGKNTLAALLTRREFFGPAPNENPQALLKESLC